MSTRHRAVSRRHAAKPHSIFRRLAAKVRRSGWVVAIVSVLALLLGLMAAPAFAIDDPKLQITMRVISPQPALSGTQITWELSYACSSLTTNCLGAVIDVPRPLGQPGNISIDYPTASGSSHTAQVLAYGPNGGPRFIFDNPLPAGSSGTLSFTFTTTNGTTPNGTTYSPVASFTASNADTVTATAPAVVSATADLAIYKGFGKPDGATFEPPLDVDVTYSIWVTDPTPFAAGNVYAANVVVTAPCRCPLQGESRLSCPPPMAVPMIWQRIPSRGPQSPSSMGTRQIATTFDMSPCSTRQLRVSRLTETH